MIDLKTLGMIITVWDPIEVMIHAPADEYNTFSVELYNMISETGKSVDDIKKAIIVLCGIDFNIHDPFFEKECGYVAELIVHLNGKLSNPAIL